MGISDQGQGTWVVTSFPTSPRHPSPRVVRTIRSVLTLSSSSLDSSVLRTSARSSVFVSSCPKTRATARNLLTKDEKDPKRIFEGQALMRRMIRYGILDEDKQRLDYLLNLKVENFLERRLQTLVYKRGLAKSIHHARVLIRQRHIRVGRQIVN